MESGSRDSRDRSDGPSAHLSQFRDRGGGDQDLKAQLDRAELLAGVACVSSQSFWQGSAR